MLSITGTCSKHFFLKAHTWLYWMKIKMLRKEILKCLPMKYLPTNVNTRYLNIFVESIPQHILRKFFKLKWRQVGCDTHLAKFSVLTTVSAQAEPLVIQMRQKTKVVCLQFPFSSWGKRTKAMKQFSLEKFSLEILWGRNMNSVTCMLSTPDWCTDLCSWSHICLADVV